MAVAMFHLLLIFAQLFVVVSGQPGFLSIDCGKPAGYNYTDMDRGIQYVSDSGFVDAGVNRKIPESYRSSGLFSQALDLRSFPNGSRNCYALPVTAGNRYMVRPFFMYGNYDGKERLPGFDVYVDMFLWGTTSIGNASINYYFEMVLVARANYMFFCLVDTGHGEAFISALELRQLPDNLYLEANASQALASTLKIDYGAQVDGSIIRYKDDDYDRLWPADTPNGWRKLQAASQVDVGNNYHPPKLVMGTAVTPANGASLSISLDPSSLSSDRRYHIFMHFAEVESLAQNQSRIFNISLNGVNFYSPLQPTYLTLTTVYTKSPRQLEKLEISIDQAEGSTLPPIINALEIYSLRQLITSGTDAGDIDAIMDIRRFYSLVYGNWMGDPCNPRSYVWDGLNCSYPTNKTSRIISLTLSSFGLSGEIAPPIGNLIELQRLDLSVNNLIGGVPDFLANLVNLVFLNLSGNNLSGGVPKSLQDRASQGTLTLSIDKEQIPVNVTTGGHEKKSNNVWKIIVAVVAAVLVLAGLLAFIYFVIIKSRRNKGKDEQSAGIASASRIGREKGSFRMPSFRAESRPFTYAELIQITNNFNKMIGRGGFGIVYYGELENGKPVAVKMLSQASSQGPKEFKMEAQLLTRIHHKNLVPLVGYCKDKGHMLLVYEYMAEGSLADHLSGKKGELSNTISWKERLRIGFEAAQGLDYLHRGCKPSIIHRDIKSSNILLSGDMEAKIADFGLSRIFLNNENRDSVSTAVMGTPGYLDPEYSATSKLNEKSDVYSFGVVLLELITGKPAIIGRPATGTINLVKWLEPLVASGDLGEIVDPKFMGDYNPNAAWKALEVAMACVAQFAVQRPTMNDVSSLLKGCLELELARGNQHGSSQSSNSWMTPTADMFPAEINSTYSTSAPRAR